MEIGGPTVGLVDNAIVTASGRDLTAGGSRVLDRDWELGAAVAAETPTLLAAARLIDRKSVV